ncbi:hypothetical protein [Curtobacterium sp. MMLR14_010]|uniref:SDH family Clp fold serine proteinase n=1 Tax=Curtobacterium sp. MMLR14_010 TaxID=1898743 RepID=UPI0009F1EF43|nr:hypothetical protein [Curtobacterium sp. MMLR14_010]
MINQLTPDPSAEEPIELAEAADATASGGQQSYVPTPPPSPIPTPGPKIPTRTPLYEAMHAERYARQNLIRDIEKTTGTTLICYIAANSQIERTDIVGIVDLLHNIHPGTPIDLMLHTPGGNIDAAEKIALLVRRRAGDASVRVIVPDYAKSAGTLIALAANTILMSDSSELGAIDPQVEIPDSNGHLQTLSAQSYLDAFHRHARRLKRKPSDPVARLMLGKMEPATVRKLERMITRSRSIAEALLSQSMVRDHDRAVDIAAHLSDTERWHSHGQMISHHNARGLGLNVTYLAPHDDLWVMYWRLFSMQLWAASGKVKLFESSWASLPM